MNLVRVKESQRSSLGPRFRMLTYIYVDVQGMGE